MNFMTLLRRFTASFIPDLLAGLTSGLVTLIYSLSFAALVFSGKLAPYFPQGVSTALIGAAVVAIVVAWRSPFPFTLAGPEANSAIILAIAGGEIASSLAAKGQEEAIYPSVWAAMFIGTSVTGLFLYLLGRFRMGQLARYIPFPVIGGFLAGTGWLITRSSFKVMTGYPLSWAHLSDLMHGEAAAQWLAAAVVAAVLTAVLKRMRHFLTLPALLLGGMVLGNVLWWVHSPGGASPARDGWFFQPFSQDRLWSAWNLETAGRIDWSVLLHHSHTLLAMLVIVMLSILLNSTGLELATSSNVDLNDELRANGVANLINGVVGGMVGYLSINRCLLNRQAGARSPWAATFAGAVCGGVLLLGSSFLKYVPKPVLGGLLLFIGINLLVRWLLQSRAELPRWDYLLVVVIFLIVAGFGFLAGVGAGILIACFLFILSYGKTPSIKLTLSGAHSQSNVVRSPPQQQLLEKEGDCLTILVLHGFVFFGTANDLLDRIRRRVLDPELPRLRYVIFDFRLVTGLDSSALLSFKKIRQVADRFDLVLLVTDLAPVIMAQLQQGGLLSQNPPSFRAFADLDRGLEWYENQLLAEHPELASSQVPVRTQLEALLQEPEMATRFLQQLRPVELPAGQLLFHEGDASDGLYFLESGRVSVVVELADGKTLRRRTYAGGTILGEMGFYSRAPRSASVIADEPSRLFHLSLEAFAQLESELPHLASRFNRGIVQLVADRLRRSEQEVRNLVG